MRKYLIVATLVVVVAALALTAALVTSDAGAFPDGWNGGCDVCHDSSVHNVAAHASIFPSDCTACHTGTPGATTADASKCAGCHGGADTLANVHVSNEFASGCTATGCHAAQVTTTTTAGETTTTTAGEVTSTTAAPTTSSSAPPTSLEEQTTTTTVPVAQPSFTG